MFKLHDKVKTIDISVDLASKRVLLYGGDSGVGKGLFCNTVVTACNFNRVVCVYINYKNYWQAPRLVSNLTEDSLVLLDNVELYASDLDRLLSLINCYVIIIGRGASVCFGKYPDLQFEFARNSLRVWEVV